MAHNVTNSLTKQCQQANPTEPLSLSVIAARVVIVMRHETDMLPYPVEVIAENIIHNIFQPLVEQYADNLQQRHNDNVYTLLNLTDVELIHEEGEEGAGVVRFRVQEQAARLLGDDNEQKSGQLLKVAVRYRVAGDFQEVLRILPEVERATNLLLDNSVKGYQFRNMATLYHAAGNIPEATRLLLEAERMSDLLPNDQMAKSDILINISKCYLRIGNIPEATRTLQKAQIMARLLPNDDGRREMLLEYIEDVNRENA